MRSLHVKRTEYYLYCGSNAQKNAWLYLNDYYSSLFMNCEKEFHKLSSFSVYYVFVCTGFIGRAYAYFNYCLFYTLMAYDHWCAFSDSVDLIATSHVCHVQD